MSVFVVVAAGVVASVRVEVEAIAHSAAGWLVVLGYDHWMAPILALVHDRDVLEVSVEGVSYRDMDDDQGLGPAELLLDEAA